MIKAVIFDIDNTLYSYDENHIYGMEALAVYSVSYTHLDVYKRQEGARHESE